MRPPHKVTRRLLLTVAAAVPAAARKKEGSEPRVVTDADQLNAFAKQYNDYVESLRGGVVRVERWNKTVAAWQRMTGGC